MNRKGFELAISTILVLILGILVVAGLVYIVTEGFKQFSNTSRSLLGSAEGSAVQQACKLACSGNDRITYCCKNFTISSKNVYCTDDRLQADCSLNCQDVCNVK